MRLLVCIFCVWVAMGCGGGGGGGSAAQSGSISLVADFAPSTRTVPGYADELRVVITPPPGVALPPAVTNPIVLSRGLATISISGLSANPAPYQLAMTAYTGTVAVGTATRSIVVEGGRTREVDVSANLNSIVAAVTVEGATSMLEGQSIQLTAHARNGQGQTLFSGNGFQWTSSSNITFTVSPDGLAQGANAGSATVTAQLAGTSISGSKNISVLASGQGASRFRNGDFEITFRQTCTQTQPHPFAYPAAALYWIMNTGAPNATASSEILPSTAPGGSGNMLRFQTNQGQNSTYNGSALAQYFPATSNVRFECDIFVLQGTVMLGPVSTSGPFYSQTTYTPNGQWRHIVIDCPAATESVAFQNVGALASTLEIYLDNVKLYYP